METSSQMHKPCNKDNKKLNADTFPADDKVHSSPAEYIRHLELREAWLAVCASLFQGIVHPRLPSNTGDLEDIQAKAAKELQKFLFGTEMSVQYSPVGSKDGDIPKKCTLPAHTGIIFIIQLICLCYL
jgi:hypothetical protein